MQQSIAAGLAAAWSTLALCGAGCDPNPLPARQDGGPVTAPPDGRVPMDGRGNDAAGRDASSNEPDGKSAGLDAGPGASCDPHFALDPAVPRAGVPLVVRITDATPWTYVDLAVSGPGDPRAEWDGVEGSYTWQYTVTGHEPGVLSMTFTAEMGAHVVARCRVSVVEGDGSDAGMPPVDGGRPGLPPTNRFGIGLVSPGDRTDMDLAADLAGAGGWVKMIFPGVTRATTGPDPAWVEAVRLAYERDLVPVVRIGPPWGDNDVRYDSDDAAHLRYTALAQAYRRVVERLPRREGWPLYVEVHNEPNLCHEWTCRAGEGWLPYETTAREYAAMLRDVADALHAIGDPTIRVVNAGLAPGGTRRCECGGSGWEAGVTSREFLAAMAAAVPDVFSRIDAFASHAYPAEGEGWGFFVPYERARPGLAYFETELTTIGRSLPVLLTETGWCLRGGARCPTNGGSRDEIAAWTEAAYVGFWLDHPSIAAVMPFMLRDVGWDDFGWTAPDGAPYPVYTRVRALRCARRPELGRCP